MGSAVTITPDAPPVTITPDALPQAAKPGFGQNLSSVTLNTEHPWEQAKSEWEQFKADPIGSLESAAKTAAMMPVNLAYQAVHHPIDTVTGLTGGPQFAQALQDKNPAGAAGALVGGMANSFPILTGAAKLSGSLPADTAKAVGARVPSAADLRAPAEAASDFKNALPPSKGAPYTIEDYQRARPYLEDEHASSPIESVEHTRDAADSAIGKIEDKIGEYIRANPQDRITTQPLRDVVNDLSSNPRGASFVKAGLSELQDFNLDQPKTLQEADAIRRQLNAENQAVMSKNNYKIETARAADPGFAAREAAAESLRNGIYDKLAQRGIPGADDIRQDEGSLIRIRNAAQNEIFNGEKVVRSTAETGPARQLAKNLTRLGTTAVGGATMGGGGAVGGNIVGNMLGNLFTSEALTKDELLERSFSKKVTNSPEFPSIPGRAPIRALLGQGSLVTQAPADTSGAIPGTQVQVDPATRAARLGLLLNAKPGEPLITPPPGGPKLLPQKSGAPIITPMPGESARDYLKRISGG